MAERTRDRRDGAGAVRRARRAAALASGVAVVAGAYVLAASVALLVLAWHMPSDVLGGILLASLWMALAVAGLRASERAFPPDRRRFGAAGPGSRESGMAAGGVRAGMLGA